MRRFERAARGFSLCTLHKFRYLHFHRSQPLLWRRLSTRSATCLLESHLDELQSHKINLNRVLIIGANGVWLISTRNSSVQGFISQVCSGYQPHNSVWEILFIEDRALSIPRYHRVCFTHDSRRLAKPLSTARNMYNNVTVDEESSSFSFLVQMWLYQSSWVGARAIYSRLHFNSYKTVLKLFRMMRLFCGW